MQIIFKILLTLHIIGGALGLVTGTINLVRKKGDKNHKRTGKLFVYGMLTAGFSSLMLSILHPNYFLFIVGVFTVYLVGTGNRYTSLKMLSFDQKPAIIDWLLTIGMLVAGLVFVGLGVYHLLDNNIFGIVFIVFGVIGLGSVKSDMDNYRGKAKAKNYWLLIHIARMTGGYISALTAFLVVNGNYLPAAIPSTLLWLLPTLILTPLIIVWTRKYKVK